MKRTLATLLVGCVALFALWLASSAGTDIDLERGPSPTIAHERAGTDTTTTTTSSSSPQSPESLVHPPAPGHGRPASVAKLADGDSFDITWTDSGERDELRLVGINAPERDACFGEDAGAVLASLVGESALTVEGIERDEFGRLLANVWVDDVFVNAAMVELGAGLAMSDGGTHTSLIEHSQELARSRGAGLWSPALCGSGAGVTLRISWIEADAPGRDNENRNGEWIEIVNDATVSADLTDWSLRDESTRHRFSFPDSFSLGPQASVRVFSGCGTDSATELYWCDDDPVWNNGGDTAFLVDPDGRFADTRSYGR